MSLLDDPYAGVSDLEGKAEAIGWLRDLTRSGTYQPRILDVGAGRGTWRELGPAGLHWTAIEAWHPYVVRFGLAAKYDVVIEGDIRTLDLSRLRPFDVAILGDVLEHLGASTARYVWARVRDVSRFVILSVPLGPYPQGAIAGNPY